MPVQTLFRSILTGNPLLIEGRSGLISHGRVWHTVDSLVSLGFSDLRLPSFPPNLHQPLPSSLPASLPSSLPRLLPSLPNSLPHSLPPFPTPSLPSRLPPSTPSLIPPMNLMSLNPKPIASTLNAHEPGDSGGPRVWGKITNSEQVPRDPLAFCECETQLKTQLGKSVNNGSNKNVWGHRGTLIAGRA